MLPINVKGAHLLAIKTNSDVDMTDNGKLTKVHMVNRKCVLSLLMTRRVKSNAV